jgi:hypothetical protein
MFYRKLHEKLDKSTQAARELAAALREHAAAMDRHSEGVLAEVKTMHDALIDQIRGHHTRVEDQTKKVGETADALRKHFGR